MALLALALTFAFVDIIFKQHFQPLITPEPEKESNVSVFLGEA